MDTYARPLLSGLRRICAFPACPPPTCPLPTIEFRSINGCVAIVEIHTSPLAALTATLGQLGIQYRYMCLVSLTTL